MFISSVFHISGGKSKAADTYSLDGKRISSDQGESDHGVRSLINCYKSKSRIVLLADDRYKLFPYDLGRHTYVVLGFYRVIYYWGKVERTARKTRRSLAILIAEYEEALNDNSRCVKFKFAFQWCDEQGEPWWTVPNGMYVVGSLGLK